MKSPFHFLTGLNHTNEEIPFDTKALLTRAIIVLQRKLFANCRGKGACSSVVDPLSYADSVEFIRRGILSGRPFMAGKVGTGDNETMLRYIDIHDRENAFVKAAKLLTGHRRPFWWDNSIRAGIGVCAGVFPPTVEGIEDFCRAYESYLPGMDAFASCADGESRVHDRYCPEAKAIAWEGLFPLHPGPTWFDALEGKRVLVVHPYERSIRAQYEKGLTREIHTGQGLFPKFELLTYRPVNSIGGRCAEFACWREALEHMIADISKIDFDVMLVGCGVYGVPLAVHAKRMGKAAVHTGGSTQLLFGIRAKAYDFWNVYNENWIHALPEDVPANMKLIENGRFL